MPLHVGAHWRYAYTETGFWANTNGPGVYYYHDEGVLELEVIERTCRDGMASYGVREINRRDGDSTTVRERVFTETEQHLVSLPPFFVPTRQFLRYHVTDADTVAATGNSPCGSHPAAGSYVRMQRDVGIDVVRTYAASRTYFCEGLMTLLEGPKPGPG